MKYVLNAVVAFVLATGLVVAEETRVITTNGVGTVEAAPDMATIRLGVTYQARQASDAMIATSDGVSAVLSRLQEAGIEGRDMQTDQLSLQPIWSDYNATPRTITGFVATNMLTVRVRDLGALGAVMDLVIRDGANAFNGLTFGLQEPKPAQDAARAAAVRDAIDRAEQLAEAAGVTLGPIQAISEQGGFARPQMMEMAAARSSDVPIASGELTISAQVNIVFGIAD